MKNATVIFGPGVDAAIVTLIDYVDLDDPDDEEFDDVLRLTAAVQRIEAVFRRIARDCVDIVCFLL